MSKRPTPTPQAAQIDIPRLDIQLLHIRLIGDSPLICHAWGRKAIEMMLAKQMKKAKPGKEAKNPESDFEESLYKMPGGGYGFPTIAFKAAAISACRFVDGIKMTEVRGAFHISGELVAINGTPTPREDMVRIGMGVADIRYRGQFEDWSADVPVRFNANSLSPEQIVNLFNVAGFGVGVGEWRPEKNGSYGMFHVATTEDVG